MRGLADMLEDDRKEVLKVYATAVTEGDEKLQKNLRYAHSVWKEDFDKVDASFAIA